MTLESPEAILLTRLAVSVIGDHLRDRLDPTLR